jgi:hypothetical protein
MQENLLGLGNDRPLFVDLLEQSDPTRSFLRCLDLNQFHEEQSSGFRKSQRKRGRNPQMAPVRVSSSGGNYVGCGLGMMIHYRAAVGYWPKADMSRCFPDLNLPLWW